MTTDFTTDAVPIADRVAYWHNVSCSTYIEYDCRIDDRNGFGAQIQAAPLADLNLSICDNTPLVAERTARHVARSDTDSMFFGFILKGSKHIEQAGRTTTASVGDCYLVDAGRPYVLTCDAQKSELVLEMPRARLEARIGSSAPLLAGVISGETGAGALATSVLRHLQRHRDELTETRATQLSTQVIDLVALALTNGARETVQRLSSAAAVSRLRLHHAIEAIFTDCRAHCADLADLAGMSPRYANLLLAEEGTSLERLLIRKRLEHCRKRLSNPEFHSHRIGDIAAASGFDSASHFARCFKEAYGVTARDYRAEAFKDAQR